MSPYYSEKDLERLNVPVEFKNDSHYIENQERLYRAWKKTKTDLINAIQYNLNQNRVYSKSAISNKKLAEYVWYILCHQYPMTKTFESRFLNKIFQEGALNHIYTSMNYLGSTLKTTSKAEIIDMIINIITDKNANRKRKINSDTGQNKKHAVSSHLNILAKHQFIDIQNDSVTGEKIISIQISTILKAIRSYTEYSESMGSNPKKISSLIDEQTSAILSHNPNYLGIKASVLAYRESNPNATTEQLSDFINKLSTVMKNVLHIVDSNVDRWMGSCRRDLNIKQENAK